MAQLMLAIERFARMQTDGGAAHISIILVQHCVGNVVAIGMLFPPATQKAADVFSKAATVLW